MRGTDNPDGGDERVRSRASVAQCGKPLPHEWRVTAHGSDPEEGGVGWAWSQFGSPRADDGTDGGETSDQMLDTFVPCHPAHHGLPGESGLLGSVDDQGYEGGGYGWKTLGAPRANTALPGAASSAGSTLTRGIGGGDLPTGTD